MMAVQETTAYPRIPYGESDFRRIRLNRWLYVDKTRFLRRLEWERLAVVFHGWELAHCNAVMSESSE